MLIQLKVPLYIQTCGQLTDEFSSYLPPVAFHCSVNHSRHFVDPATGVHTQNIERNWNRVKTKLKRMKGQGSKLTPAHIPAAGKIVKGQPKITNIFLMPARMGRLPQSYRASKYCTFVVVLNTNLPS